MTFNLLDRPWIPVLDEEGANEVPLRDALLRAGELKGLAATPPTMTLVLLRFLVAVVLHALGAPKSEAEWGERWSQGHLPTDRIEAYLERYHDRFDLFSPTAPFAQAPGIGSPKGETKPSSVLIPSEPSGNAVPLFGTRTEASPPPLTPPEAARWLLHALGWDTAGIKTGLEGDPAARNGRLYGTPTGPLGQLGAVYPIGRTLFETLHLNTFVLADGLAPGDEPAWTREPLDATWQEREPTGILDLLTWTSRRIRLIPEDVGEHVVVRQVVLSGGDRLVTIPHDLEPHTLWRWDDGGRDRPPGHRPRRHTSGRAAWEGLNALVALGAESDGGLQTSMLLRQIGTLQAVGVLDRHYPLVVGICGCEYGNQSAVVENVIDDVLPLPVAALTTDAEIRELLIDVAASTNALIGALDGLDGDLRRSAGGEPLPWNKGQRPGTGLVGRLDLFARQLLIALQSDPDRIEEARLRWASVAREVSDELAEKILAVVPPTAWAGRDEDGGSRQRRTNVALADRNYRRRRNKALESFLLDEGIGVGR